MLGSATITMANHSMVVLAILLLGFYSLDIVLIFVVLKF